MTDTLELLQISENENQNAVGAPQLATVASPPITDGEPSDTNEPGQQAEDATAATALVEVDRNANLPSIVPWLDASEHPDPDAVVTRIWSRASDDRNSTIENAIDIAYLVKTWPLAKVSESLDPYIPSTRVSKFARIGRSPLTLPDIRNDLPSGWSILFELSFLSSIFLRECIADKRVHPRMSHDDAKALRPKSPQRPRKSKSPLPSFGPHTLDMEIINRSDEAKAVLQRLVELGGARPANDTSIPETEQSMERDNESR